MAVGSAALGLFQRGQRSGAHLGNPGGPLTHGAAMLAGVGSLGMWVLFLLTSMAAAPCREGSWCHGPQAAPWG